MPLTLKVFNIILTSILTFVFTQTNYNLVLSLLFAFLTTIFIYLYIGLFFAMLFFVLYIVLLLKKSNEKKLTQGTIIEQTNIPKTTNKIAFQCDNPATPKNNIVSYKKFRNDLDNRDFSICVFLYINGSNPVYKNNFYNYRYKDWKSVFYFGNSEIMSDSMNENVEEEDDKIKTKKYNYLNQMPGLWLKPSLNNLVLAIKNGSINERLELNDVPLNEWFSITIIMNSSSVSLYQNCKLEKIVNLDKIIPDTSEYNLFIANDANLIVYDDNKKRNGFAGQMAYFTYYNFILTQNQINDYCSKYKKSLEKYQEKQNQNVTYNTSCLVTDSDVNSLN